MSRTLPVPRRGTFLIDRLFGGCGSSSTTHFPFDMAVTKLRSSSMSLHGVFHKSRVFDPTCLFEAKAKPMIQQKCLSDSDIVNYVDVENLYRTPINNNLAAWLLGVRCESLAVAGLASFRGIRISLVGVVGGGNKKKSGP